MFAKVLLGLTLVLAVAAGCGGRAEPGAWVGTMTGTMSGRTFTATASISVSSRFEVAGSWDSYGAYEGDGWRGNLRGLVLEGGELSCWDLDPPGRGLCVSTPGISVVGVFAGALDGEENEGEWAFSASDSEYDGRGRWSLRRR